MTETAPRTHIWHNARIWTGTGPDKELTCGLVAALNGLILYAGPEADAPELPNAERTDCNGRLITPALIDCHTHILYGGNRAREFAIRHEGGTYIDIAKAGGGIASTVAATRALSEEELLETSLKRIDALLSEGVTTIEIKSGYGLTIADEIKMLRAARTLSTRRHVRVRTSYLAAHALPPEYREQRNAYLKEVVLPGLKIAHEHSLVDAVDAFCETIAFREEEICLLFDMAHRLGLPVKLHAEQMTQGSGAKLAARYHALSADHLEYLSADDAQAFASAGTVAVLLPGAYYALREDKKPPVDALRKAGTRIAMATDCNPGTSPLTSLLWAMNLGATLFSLTAGEALRAVTTNAAHALGLQTKTGALKPGLFADLAIWDVSNPEELVYGMGFNPLWRRIFNGQITES